MKLLRNKKGDYWMEELKDNICDLITDIKNKIDNKEVKEDYAKGYIKALEDVVLKLKNIELNNIIKELIN